MTVKQLTQALYVKAPAVSMMVNRLVELGILTRQENPADRQKGPRQEQLAVATNSAAISPAGTSGRGTG
jgi:predicted transcriptional regulator